MPGAKCALAALCVAVSINIFISSDALSQHRWKEGYVVSVAGDTLKGKIAFSERTKFPRVISFKKEDGTKKKYAAENIRAFGVSLSYQEVHFKTLTTTIDMSSADLNSIDNDPTPRMAKHTFFAELLQNGSRPLYAYREPASAKRHFLVEDSIGKFTDLIHHRYYVDIGKTQPAYFNGYIDQLMKIYHDCNSINYERVTGTAYKDESMISIVKQYNRCMQMGDTSYTFQREKIMPEFGVVAGVGITSFKDKGETIQLPSAATPAAGVFLNLTVPHTERRWAVYNELLVTRYSSISGKFVNQDLDTEQLSINQTYLRWNLAARYQWAGKKNMFFLQAGVGNSISVQHSGREKIHSSYAYVHDKDIELTSARTYEVSVFASAGITYKKFSAEFRLWKASAFSDLNVTTSCGAILVKYNVL